MMFTMYYMMLMLLQLLRLRQMQSTFLTAQRDLLTPHGRRPRPLLPGNVPAACTAQTVLLVPATNRQHSFHSVERTQRTTAVHSMPSTARSILVTSSRGCL